MTDYIPMSRSGHAKLMAELNLLEDIEMPKIAKRIAEARAEGDLKENAEYHGARESQGMMQAKINLLRDQHRDKTCHHCRKRQVFKKGHENTEG